MRFRCTVTRFVGTDVFPLHGVGPRLAWASWSDRRNRPAPRRPRRGLEVRYACGLARVSRMARRQWIRPIALGLRPSGGDRLMSAKKEPEGWPSVLLAKYIR